MAVSRKGGMGIGGRRFGRRLLDVDRGEGGDECG